MAQQELGSSALQQPNSTLRSLVARIPSSLPRPDQPRQVQLPNTNSLGAEDKQSKIPTAMPSTSMSPASVDLVRRLDELEISFTITTAMGYFSAQQLDQAKQEIKKAVHLATTKRLKIHALRCHYWIGRIEFERQDFASAYKHFTAAMPCLIYNEYPEGDDLMLYLRLSQPEVTNEIRKSILRKHARAVFREWPHSVRAKKSIETKSRTHTPSDDSWDRALHPQKKRPPNIRKKSGPGQSDQAEQPEVPERVLGSLEGLGLRGAHSTSYTTREGRD
ncbi:hypothetical protein N7468_002708 [Penicillium chermesinum]|uniref:Uncharacterized protein n=1 Tax=Penicillium chermesinum TaxID=63820 RepID=A0A9W9PJ54_9EURO|nr:uncharacterized protein N7468_002708 [Penicillium chermesinum]KAJ5247725.1 hypothetical protein N7468_002708 [Penicillium chermesinum]KAJ6151490.1 hypothetical protein N7470_007087 [Penicillium chermesinum]